MNTKIKNAWNTLSTPGEFMDFDKFEQICNSVDATPARIADFIDGGENGWDDPDEHNIWLRNADADEIAGWVSAGLR